MNESIEILAGALGASLAQFSQDTRFLRLHTSLGADALVVESFEGVEAISQGYRLDVIVLSTDTHLELKRLMGQPVLLELLPQHSRTQLRPFHGHVSAFELVGSDGGFARYRLGIEPWISFLAHRRDSYVFQDKSVVQMLEEIFGDYAGQGQLIPAWRFDLADASAYQARRYTVQYGETDYAFVQRLMAEEGLYWWFEHQGQPAATPLSPPSPPFGTHTLVIADHNGAFKPNVQSRIRYHRAAAVEREDAITAFAPAGQIQARSIAAASWDYRNSAPTQASSLSSLGNQSESGADTLGGDHVITDHSGHGGYDDSPHAQRYADRAQQALDARTQRFSGRSSVRTLAVGTRYTLTDHPLIDAYTPQTENGAANADFIVLEVRHAARNNLGATRLTPQGSALQDTAQDAPLDTLPLYTNHFRCQPASLPWRSLTDQGHGLLLHPKPTAPGPQTAIVVGSAGPLHTERDHRIKIQFHWQRGNQSHSRQSHPAGDNAPGDQAASIWVRVLEAWAGPDWGANFTPRLGQEVVVDFIEGDIDRPVIVGSVYNGQGQEQAQGQQVGKGAGPAQGQAPAWFAGNGHPGVMSGFKTQAMSASTQGQGGYNQLVFDDSPQELGTRLASTAHQSELNLGHLKHHTDNQRIASRGHGFELRTQAYGAVRAGQGVLLSTDARVGGMGGKLDHREAQAQLDQAAQLSQTLADTADRHHATQGDPALTKTGFDNMRTSLQARETGSGGRSAGGEQGEGDSGGGSGSVAALGRPDLIASSPGGIGLLTPRDAILTGADISTVAARDIDLVSGEQLTAHAAQGISLFTYGKPATEQGESGIKLHAAAKKANLEAHSDTLSAAADQDVTVASNEAVHIGAKTHVLLTAGGAYVKLEGGDVQIHGPGTMTFKASKFNWTSAGSEPWIAPHLPQGKLAPDMLEVSHLYHDDAGVQGAAFEAILSDGSQRSGVTDGAGKAVLSAVPLGAVRIRFKSDARPYSVKPTDANPDYKPAISAGDWDALFTKHAGDGA